MPPPGQSWRWEDPSTGESGVMPWGQERDPTDYEIDSYRARERWNSENTGLKNWARSYIPDEVEDWWTARNKPHSTFMGDQFKDAYKANQGQPLSMPFMGFNVPMPQGVGEFAGSMLDDQTSDINLTLNALTLGGYAGLSGLGSGAKAGLTTLGKLGGAGQMAQGAIGLGGGGINMADALSKGDEATWGDYGNAALQMGLGAFGVWGGKGDYDAMAPKPKPPGPITDPARLLGPGGGPPPPPSGARFEAGPSGIGDLSDPNYVPGSAGAAPPPGGGGRIDIAGLGQGPDVLGEHSLADPFAATPAQDLQLQPPVSPRGPSAGQPFEQNAGIWQQFRQEPGAEGMDLAAHQLQDPVVPNTTVDGPGASRPASDFWRTVVAEGAPPPTPRAVSALGAVEPPNIPEVKPPIESLAPDLEADMQLIVDRGEFTLDDLGHDPDKIHAYAEIIRNSDGAPVGSHPDDIQAVQAEAAAAAPAPVAPTNIDAGPATTRMAPPAPTPAPALPTPVAPVRDAASRVAVMPDKPLVRPKVPGKPTPDRILRIGRGVHDAVRAIFPDKLHVDLFSALGRAKRQMRGERGGIAPNYEGLAEQLGVSLKEAHRIADEYRLKVLKITKEAPGLGPEGSDTVDIEMPHWGGKAPEMVKAAPDLRDPADVPFAEHVAESAAAPVMDPQVASIVADQIARNPAAELNAALAARGALPEPKAATPATTLPKTKNARVKLVMAKLGALPVSEVQDITNDPAKLLSIAKAAGIKSTTLKTAIQNMFEKVDMSKVAKAVDKSSDRSPKAAALRKFKEEFNAKIKAGIPDAREQGELEQVITRIYKDMNPALRVEAGNTRAKAALDLLRVVRAKTDGSVKIIRRLFPEITDETVRVGRQIRELSYGKLKMEKEDIINHYLDTGKVGLPDPDIDMIDDPNLSKVQAWFKKHGGSDTGALNIKLPSKQDLVQGFEKSFDAANSVRMTSMLSGLAFPKSLAGNIGAHLAAALEGRTLEPLKVLANLKAIKRDLKVGWKSHANPALVQGVNRFNAPGRAMGAFDYAGIESLKRAGLSEKEAKELMLTGSNAISAWWPLQGRAGKFLVPFRTTPFNQLAQGLTRWKKHKDVYAAAVMLGAWTGAKIEDREGIAMMSALAGPYALPFLVGAYIGGGRKNADILGGISPIPDWGITKTIQNTLSNPFKLITDSPGKRWFRPGAGWGAEAKEEKRKESLERRRAKRRAEVEASQ